MSEHELWNELGNLYYLSGSYHQAIYAYNRSIQMESRFGRPYSNLALTYVQQGKYAEAAKLYQKGIELLPDKKEKAISWYRLGDVYRCMKDYRDAILAYQQGDMLDPTINQNSEELGEVLYGPSNLTSAPELSKDQATEKAQLAASPSSSDSLEAGARSIKLVESSSVPTVESEPMTTEEVATAIEEPKADLTPESLIVQQETKEIVLFGKKQSVPEFEDEFFPMLLEQEPVEEMEGEEPSDWPFYFGAETPEHTFTHALSREFSATDPIVLAPRLNPTPLMLKSGSFSPNTARETQMDTIVQTDFQNVTVAESKEHLSLIQEAPSELMESTPVAQDVVGVQEDGTVESVTPQDEVKAILEVTTTEEVAAAQDNAIFENADVLEEASATADAEPEVYAEPSAAVLTETELEIVKIKQELEIDPKNAYTWQTLGDMQKSIGMYEDAICSYQQAVANDPKNIDYLYRLGMSYAIEGRVDEAVKMFQEILITNPNHGLAHATLSGCYRKMGFEDLAKKHINIAMKKIYETENEYNRACMQALYGNADEAFTLLKIALENKQTYVDWVLRDPDLDNIKLDPRFQQLISNFL